MALFDYHSHSHYCDGRGNLADYVDAALARGLSIFGMSGHAPCAIASSWHMKADDLGPYLDEARSLSRERADRIELLVGLEADFVPGVIAPRAVREAHGLDYVIGSVHYLGRLADGTPWTVDGPAEELRRGIRESFGGDSHAAVRRYFALVAAMASTSPPDIIGHIDLIRKNNDGLFDAEASWYGQAVEEALDAVAASQAVVEINTGAVSRGYAVGIYPSAGTLASMARRGIPVTLGSDAHRPEHVAAHFDAALDCLARAGYRECWRLERAGWKAQPLDGIAGGRAK